MWRAYAEQEGLPALGSEATERQMALLTWQVNLGRGGQTKYEDWLPQPKSVHESQTLKIARMMGIKV